VEFVGLARVPRLIAQLLASAASSASLAGAELYAASRAAEDRERLVQVVSDARRSCDDALLAAAHMLGGGLDRDDVVAIAQSLRLMTDRIEEAAVSLRRLGSRESWETVAGVERDLAREVAAIVAELDRGLDATDRRFQRVESLHQEGNRLLRTARAALLRGDDFARAVAGQSVVDRIELAMLASRDSARTVRRVLVKHR
jgi:hypothetical protein